MEPIQNFAQLTAHLKQQNRRKRIAVVCANDPNTEYAITRALEEGIAEFLMIGDSAILEKYPALKKYPLPLHARCGQLRVPLRPNLRCEWSSHSRDIASRQDIFPE